MRVNKIGIKNNGEAQERVQRFGRFLSGMVMPNIGAFIAWGIINILFMPDGWIPNEKLYQLVNPIVHYLLPSLIGYTGGRMVGGVRGGVLGALATMGVIVGGSKDVHQFMGAMIIGPVGGYVLKKFDEILESRIPAGFEMLVNNFSAGIIGVVITILGFLGVGPVVEGITALLKGGVEIVIDAGFLPLTSIFIEPAKILFLNNAINFGILGPIGLSQVADEGKSIMFLLEANPGPGFGLLLAYWIFGRKEVRELVPGAILIQFLGGIHEIYFPYVLMKPILVLAVILGGISGVFTLSVLDAGLISTPSPGSIFSVIAMAPKGGLLSVLTGVVVSTIVSFVVAAFFIKKSKVKVDEIELEYAKGKSEELKGIIQTNRRDSDLIKITDRKNIKKVIFACDAGVGSSAMGATTLRNKLRKAGIEIEVVNCALDQLPYDAEIVITHESLLRRAKSSAPKAEHIAVKDFIKNDAFERLSTMLQVNSLEDNEIRNEENEEKNLILRKKNIKLNLKASDKYEAIITAGTLLVDGGYVDEEYIQAMIERENDLSTYIGQGVAIPHGVGASKDKIINSGMVVLQYPDGVLFGEELAYIVVGIAGVGDKHLSILGNIAMAIGEANEEVLEKLKSTDDIGYIYNLFTGK